MIAISEREAVRILDFGPIRALVGVFRRAIHFAIENLTPNGISWQHFPLVLRLSKGEHPIATRLVRQNHAWLSADEYRLRFSVWSARNAFAVAQSDLTFSGEINRLAEDPRGFLRRVKAG